MILTSGRGMNMQGAKLKKKSRVGKKGKEDEIFMCQNDHVTTPKRISKDI